MRQEERRAIEEQLDELSVKINRLKIEYDQYFMGAMKREPFVLRGDVQKTITRFMSAPPPHHALKFKLNSIVARYHAYRNMWGRTMREIEAGTYRRHRMKAKMHEQTGDEPPAKRPAAEKPTEGAKPAKPIDRLYDALVGARKKTGEGGNLTRDKLADTIRAQTAQLKQKYGKDRKVAFKVVIEGNRAKIKASVKD
jgi:hypothetical protein